MGLGGSKKKVEPQSKEPSKIPLKISNQGGPPYEPFKDFPDYQKLVQARKDFAASTYDIDNDKDGVPVAFPTTSRGAESLSKDRKCVVDAHVKAANMTLSRDAKKLVSHLTKITQTDSEKLWAIFAWISSRNRENTIPELQNGTPEPNSPLSRLAGIMQNAHTSQYCTLFTELLQVADIPCKKVTVYIRASAPEIGKHATSKTDVCIALADKNWRFIQPNWGCCYVKRVKTPEDWLLVQGEAGKKSGLATPTPELLGFNREDFWFMVDPEIMAYFFLSQDQNLQLLPRSISLDEYSQMARLYQPFFNMGFTSISPARCKLDVHEEITIEIGVPKNLNVKFGYAIYKRAFDPDIKHVKYKDIKQFVFMDVVGNKLRAKFQLPFIGVYKFEINGKNREYTSPVVLCEYYIDCKTPNFACKPYPENSFQVWGSGPGVDLKPLDDNGGLIEAKNGKAHIKFKINTGENTKYKYSLEGKSGPIAKPDDYVRHYTDQGGTQNIIARTPKHGYYILKVSSKGETEKSFKNISNYLVISDQGVSDTTPFPEAPNGRIGQMEDNDSPGLAPVSHKEPFFTHNSDGSLEIRMKEERDGLQVISSLMKQHDNSSKYVYSYKDVNERVFILRLTEAGWYDFQLNGKYSETDSKVQRLFRYVIINDKPTKNGLPFPERLGAWKDEYNIIEPRDGLLQQNHQQLFRISIKNCEQVILSRDREEVHMTHDSTTKDEWEGKISTGPAGGVIKVIVKVKNQEKAEILQYRVLGTFDEEQLKKKQNESAKKAEERQRELERKQREEERDAETRKREAEKKVKALKRDFEENKSKYYEKQRKLEEEASRKEPNFGNSFTEFQNRKEVHKKEMHGWQEIFDDINGKMPIEKLREALKSRERTRLEKAILDAKNHNVPMDNPVMIEARKEVDILFVRDDLHEAMDTKDPDAIREQISKISNTTKYISRLQQDVSEALQLLERIMKIRSMKVSHLDLSSKTLSEIRRYNKPTKTLHRVFTATLLLFGEDEETTQDWKYIQQLINPNNAQNFLRRVMEFTPENVHPEIAARSKQILEDYEMEEIQNVSPAAATFYAWTMGVVDSKLAPPNDKVTPANIPRQMELFGKPLPSPRRTYDFRFSKR